MNEAVKLVVFVPLSHADDVRQALGEAGAGKLGNYSFCSFSSHGTGRYKGNKNSKPFIGKAGQLESAEEERIEVTDRTIRVSRCNSRYEICSPLMMKSHTTFTRWRE